MNETLRGAAFGKAHRKRNSSTKLVTSTRDDLLGRIFLTMVIAHECQMKYKEASWRTVCGKRICDVIGSFPSAPHGFV